MNKFASFIMKSIIVSIISIIFLNSMQANAQDKNLESNTIEIKILDENDNILISSKNKIDDEINLRVGKDIEYTKSCSNFKGEIKCEKDKVYDGIMINISKKDVDVFDINFHMSIFEKLQKQNLDELEIEMPQVSVKHMHFTVDLKDSNKNTYPIENNKRIVISKI